MGAGVFVEPQVRGLNCGDVGAVGPDLDASIVDHLSTPRHVLHERFGPKRIGPDQKCRGQLALLGRRADRRVCDVGNFDFLHGIEFCQILLGALPCPAPLRHLAPFCLRRKEGPLRGALPRWAET